MRIRFGDKHFVCKCANLKQQYVADNE